MRNSVKNTILYSFVAVFFPAFAFAQKPTSENTLAPARTAVVIYLDTSGSMNGNRGTAMKEGAKLAVATLDSGQEVVIVNFCHAARAVRFSLKTVAGRQAAMRHIDGLFIDGGTDYLCALRAVNLPRGTPGIFLSDGEHNGDPAPVLAHLKNQKPGPLFTVAIEAPPDANTLLSQMAALTAGNHVRVEHSEALVKVFLDLAKSLGNYRTFTPKEETVECKDVVGKLIAFGFNAVPQVTGQPAIGPAVYQHQARLPGEHVNLTAVHLSDRTAVTIEATQKRSSSGRLAAILRQDLLRAQMRLHAPEGKAGAGTNLKVTTEFFDQEGKVVDPRNRLDLSSMYRVLDQSGKLLLQVMAKPSVTQPSLEASIPLPKSNGPVTIRNITTDESQGPAFEAEQSRTILLEDPIALTVQPDRLLLEAKEGRFDTSLTIRTGKPLAATFTANLEGATPGIRLLEARSKNDVLELTLEAQPGSYKGVVVIDGAAALPLETARVPIEINVGTRSLGLALPATRDLKLGPVLANCGSKVITALELPGLDTDEVSYTIDVEDLSNGSAVIPCEADHRTITASKNQSAKITLTAEIGNVGTGDYTGAVLVKLPGRSGKAWRTNLTLRVSEPLTARLLDFGTVEVGKTVTQSFVLKNAAEALRDIRCIEAVIEGKGGAIIATLPQKIDLAGQQEKNVAVTLTVSPLVESRGLHKGTLILRRTANQELAIPMHVDIVDVGKGPCSLLVAPRNIQLRGKPGEVLQFQVRTKLAVGAAATAEELTAVAGTFQDSTGSSIELEIALKWMPDSRLTRTAAATVQGFLVVPDRRGDFTAMLTIRSANSGTILLPVTLKVQ